MGRSTACEPVDSCHTQGACDPVSGACSAPVKADGDSCDDEDPCTLTDTCSAGVCGGVGKPNDAFGDWAIGLAGDGVDWIRAVVATDDGAIVVTGTTTSQSLSLGQDTNGQPVAVGVSDAGLTALFVARFDTSGTPVRAKVVAKSEHLMPYARALAVNDGESYVLGGWRGLCYFAGTSAPVSAGDSTQLFVAKLDLGMSTAWVAKTEAISAQATVLEVAIPSLAAMGDGSVLIATGVAGELRLVGTNDSSTSFGAADAPGTGGLAMLSTSGRAVWSETLAPLPDVQSMFLPTDVFALPNGQAVVAGLGLNGFSFGEESFPLTPGSALAPAVMRLGASLEPTWTGYVVPGEGEEAILTAIEVSKDGDIALALAPGAAAFVGSDSNESPLVAAQGPLVATLDTMNNLVGQSSIVADRLRITDLDFGQGTLTAVGALSGAASFGEGSLIEGPPPTSGETAIVAARWTADSMGLEWATSLGGQPAQTIGVVIGDAGRDAALTLGTSEWGTFVGTGFVGTGAFGTAAASIELTSLPQGGAPTRDALLMRFDSAGGLSCP